MLGRILDRSSLAQGCQRRTFTERNEGSSPSNLPQFEKEHYLPLLLVTSMVYLSSTLSLTMLDCCGQ